MLSVIAGGIADCGCKPSRQIIHEEIAREAVTHRRSCQDERNPFTVWINQVAEVLFTLGSKVVVATQLIRDNGEAKTIEPILATLYDFFEEVNELVGDEPGH